MTVSLETTHGKAGTAPGLSLWREIELYLAFWAIVRGPVPAPGGERQAHDVR
jgi:hypothetical protein